MKRHSRDIDGAAIGNIVGRRRDRSGGCDGIPDASRFVITKLDLIRGPRA